MTLIEAAVVLLVTARDIGREHTSGGGSHICTACGMFMPCDEARTADELMEMGRMLLRREGVLS